MALGPRLDLRQSQQLVMTPQLQQAIKLLQLSNLELADYVGQEVERNPLLETGDPNDAPLKAESSTAEDFGDFNMDGFREGGNDGGGGGESGGEAGDGMVATDAVIGGGVDSSASNETALDADMGQNVYNNDSFSDGVNGSGAGASSAAGGSGDLGYDGGGAVKGGGGMIDGEFSLDQTLEASENLHDYLSRQMLVALSTTVDQLIATHLIDLVDDAGYINNALALELAERLGCDEDDIGRIIGVLQTLEPSGVCARDLKECLALQLQDLDRYDPAMEKMVENLDLLAKREMAQLKRICEVDQEDLTDMIRELRALNPKPGLLYGSENVQPVVPDVFVYINKAGTWSVELNTDTLPKVLVNNSYLAELNQVSTGKEAKSFINDCVSNANWLVKALDQRARTILKVSTAIVKLQGRFFDHGIRFMKPLTLKDIAEEIEMHESTVSRVTNNKFMSCPRGMFELKYFFTSSISSADGGEAHSAESVKYRIKELIDTEEPKKILSDDKLVTILKSEGMDIARRTVAKYREALRMPSSVQRRRQKNM